MIIISIISLVGHYNNMMHPNHIGSNIQQPQPVVHPSSYPDYNNPMSRVMNDPQNMQHPPPAHFQPMPG